MATIGITSSTLLATPIDLALLRIGSVLPHLWLLWQTFLNWGIGLLLWWPISATLNLIGVSTENAAGDRSMEDVLERLPRRILSVIQNDSSAPEVPESTQSPRPGKPFKPLVKLPHLIAWLAAGFAFLFGVLLISAGLERGTPSQILLTGSGCDVARIAGATPEESQNKCVLRAYYRPGVFHDGARIDLGSGKSFDIGGQQILGRIDDHRFSAPLGPSQKVLLWSGIGLLVSAFVMLIAGFVWRVQEISGQGRGAK